MTHTNGLDICMLEHSNAWAMHILCHGHNAFWGMCIARSNMWCSFEPP
jgi:hypothetical protein